MEARWNEEMWEIEIYVEVGIEELEIAQFFLLKAEVFDAVDSWKVRYLINFIWMTGLMSFVSAFLDTFPRDWNWEYSRIYLRF